MRGTDEFTVQQLMNFLYAQEEALIEENAKDVPQMGMAYIQGNNSWLDRLAAEHRERCKKIDWLQEFRADVERKCGELFDAEQRKQAGEGTEG